MANTIQKELIFIHTDDETTTMEAMEKAIAEIHTHTLYNWDVLIHFVCKIRNINILIEIQIPTADGLEYEIKNTMAAYTFTGDLENYTAENTIDEKEINLTENVIEEMRQYALICYDMLTVDERLTDTQYYLDAIEADYKHIVDLNNILHRIKQDENYQGKQTLVEIKNSIRISKRDIRYLYNAIIKENHFDEMMQIINADTHDMLKFDLFNNFSLENRLVEVK